jgi:hypothetical protein
MLLNLFSNAPHIPGTRLQFKSRPTTPLDKYAFFSHMRTPDVKSRLVAGQGGLPIADLCN